MLAKSAPSAAPLASSPLASGGWSPVFWQANSTKRLRFVHLATRVASRRGARRPNCGSTMWGALFGDATAHMTWDWIEVGRGIVAMVDPLRFTTNMRVLDREGDELNPTQAALHFNRFAQGLPWQ